MKLKIAAIAAVLLLTGCAQTGYIPQLAEKVPQLVDTFGEAGLLELGEAVCAAFDDGLSENQIAGTLETNGLTIAEAGSVVVAARDHLC